MKKHLLKLTGILLIAALYANTGKAQNVGDAAPDFTLQKLGGGEFTLSDQDGKVVFIFFFGNSCSHCLANGPNTQTDIYAQYMNDPNFVAIGIDTWDGNSSAVQSYKSSTNIEYPLLLTGSQVVKDYATTYDRIVIVDTDGRIQYKSTTNADKATSAVAAAVVGRLLEGTSSSLSLDFDIGSFTLTPNVVEHELILSNPFEAADLVNVKILNLSGQQVWNNMIQTGSQTRIDISFLSPGSYLVVLQNNREILTSRFIKPK